MRENECLHIANPQVEWVIDSTTSYHVTPMRDLFTTYSGGDYERVRMGNESFATIFGIGGIFVVTNVGCTLTLKDVRHVPNMRLNLISTYALDKPGFESYFGNGRWKLTKWSVVYVRENVCCALYKT